MRSTRLILAVILGLGALAGAALAGPRGPMTGSQMGQSGSIGKHMLLMLDTDGSGGVDADEILAEQARLFGAIDIDGDGILSVDEFRRRGQLLHMIGAVSLFDMLDANGDRTLDTDEIGAPSLRWFQRYDADQDGSINVDEIDLGRRPR